MLARGGNQEEPSLVQYGIPVFVRCRQVVGYLRAASYGQNQLLSPTTLLSNWFVEVMRARTHIFQSDHIGRDAWSPADNSKSSWRSDSEENPRISRSYDTQIARIPTTYWLIPWGHSINPNTLSVKLFEKLSQKHSPRCQKKLCERRPENCT